MNGKKIAIGELNLRPLKSIHIYEGCVDSYVFDAVLFRFTY